MTNREIYDEARRLYYWHSDWKFVKVSSLNYIAWGDGGLKILSDVQKVTLTSQDVVAVFRQYLDFFPNLKVMVIDFPSHMTLKTRLEVKDHAKTARRVRNGDWWRNKVGPYLPGASNRNFSIKIGIQTTYEDDLANKEVGAPSRYLVILADTSQMILIDVDRSTVTRNFRPVDPPPTYGFLHVSTNIAEFQRSTDSKIDAILRRPRRRAHHDRSHRR